MGYTLYYTTNFIFTGLAVAVSFRSGVFNIGMDGQFILGALFATIAALALKGSGRVPVAVMGDGDFLMGVTALWTAVHYRIPGLMVIANNRSFFNDEMHQERVAKELSTVEKIEADPYLYGPIPNKADFQKSKARLKAERDAIPPPPVRDDAERKRLVERRQQLLALTRRPAEQRQIVHQRLGQDALLAELGHTGRAVSL